MTSSSGWDTERDTWLRSCIKEGGVGMDYDSPCSGLIGQLAKYTRSALQRTGCVIGGQ